MNNTTNNIGKKAHNIMIYNRKQMSISGVLRVENFNESNITLLTDSCLMQIEGRELHISKLSLETGDLNIEGEISGLFYTDGAGAKAAGFFSKIFK